MYWLSIIPILISYIAIVKTKRAFESVILGIISGMIIYCAMVGNWNIPQIFYDFLSNVCSKPGNVWVIIFTLAIGPVTQLLDDAGATLAFTNWVSNRPSKGKELTHEAAQKRSLLSTIVLGIVVYADEYLKAGVLDSYCKTIGKKHKIPIEVLGMMIVALCIPLVTWFPMATWSVYFLSILSDSGIATNGVVDWITKIMPYMFFPIILTIIIVLFALGIIPPLGKIKKHLADAADGTYDFSVYGDAKEAESHEIKAKVFDFIIPLVLLLALGIIYNGDLVIACIVVIFFEIIWFVARGILTLDQAMKSFWDGLNITFMPTVYIVFGYVFTSFVQEIGFSELVTVIAHVIVPGAMLLYFFIAACAVGTLTGIFWPTTALFVTTSLPIAQEMGINPFIIPAVVFTAATLGTVLSPRHNLVVFIGGQLHTNPVDLVRTVRPYAWIAAGITAVAYLILGFIIA